MRCSQCGFEAVQGATFCARCGARMVTPRPETKREYALTRILPSWWHFSRELFVFVIIVAAAIYCLATQPGLELGMGLMALAGVVLGMVALARSYTSWSLTSDRLIERRGFIARHRREMELADVRSIEVDRSVVQRLTGLGNVMIASAASTDFLIRMQDIPDPERVAEILRQARLKRLA